jgi:hypothetical protein
MAGYTGYLCRPLLHRSAPAASAPSAPDIGASLSGDQRTATPSP